jgi:hypothetical protein
VGLGDDHDAGTLERVLDHSASERIIVRHDDAHRLQLLP